MSARNTARRSTPIRPSGSAPPRLRATPIRRGSPPPVTAQSRPRSARGRPSTSPRTITSNIWRRTVGVWRARRHRSGLPGGHRDCRHWGDRLTQIYIDGDACPVREEVYRVAARLGLGVFVVTNGSRPLRPPRLDNVQLIFVGDTADAADDWIADKIDAADVCVTSDIPLAARCLAKGARVV